MRVLAALLAFVAVVFAGLALAAGRTTKPVVIIEKPGNCVEAIEVMRRDHMKLLLHQRDRTMHQGIRTKRHSLTGCIECHASTKTGSVLGEKGFCESCHSYAGVRLDCWECHTPKARAQAAGAAR